MNANKKIHNIVASADFSQAMRHIKNEFMLSIRGYLRPKMEDDALVTKAEHAARQALEVTLSERGGKIICPHCSSEEIDFDAGNGGDQFNDRDGNEYQTYSGACRNCGKTVYLTAKYIGVLTEEEVDALKNNGSTSRLEQESLGATEAHKATTPNLDAFTFIDLGLPSGKLWATENIKDENGNEAHLNWGDAMATYRENMPSKEYWKELFDHCTRKWLSKSKAPGKKCSGYLLTGPNGNTLFLPAAGYRFGVSVISAGSGGYYWSSSVGGVNYAYGVVFSSGGVSPQVSYSRYDGSSVRLAR